MRDIIEIHRSRIHQHPQWPPFDQFHHEKGTPIIRKIAVNDAHNAWVIDACQSLGFLREFSCQPFVPLRGLEQKFDHYRHAMQSLITRQIDDTDATAP
jgi:hypothetical protein